MPNNTFSRMIHDMRESAVEAPTGRSLVEIFFKEMAEGHPLSVGGFDFAHIRELLQSDDFNYQQVCGFMDVSMLQTFEEWMKGRDYVALGWTGYDGPTVDDYYNGRMLDWFKDPSSDAPRYTEYSGCRLQFIDADEIKRDGSLSLMSELMSTIMGTHGGPSSSRYIHDKDNDILAGRKVVIFRDLDGLCHLFYCKKDPISHRNTIAVSKLNEEITNGFEDEYFLTGKKYGTIISRGEEEEESDIPNVLMERIDDFICDNGGRSFLGCWNAIYLSRKPEIYGGMIETDERGEKVAEGAAMCRVFVHKSLLKAGKHIYLPELDVENTGLGNHLARKLQIEAVGGAVALTVPERYMDSTDPGEETILMGSKLPGVCVSIPVCNDISEVCLSLAVFPYKAHDLGLDREQVDYIMHNQPTLEVSSLSKGSHDKEFVIKAGDTEISFEYSGRFAFTGEFIEAILNLGKSLTPRDFNFVDSFGDNMVLYAAKNGYLGMLELLERSGARLVGVKNTTNGKTPLACALSNGHDAVVRKLMTYEAGLQSPTLCLRIPDHSSSAEAGAGGYNIEGSYPESERLTSEELALKTLGLF